jgi:Na+/H+ antiporter 1
MYVGSLSVEHWVNAALMAVFFLLIGLELERELYNGELSNFKNALLNCFPCADSFFLEYRNAAAKAGIADSERRYRINGFSRHRSVSGKDA